jgi:hypothetical protein
VGLDVSSTTDFEETVSRLRKAKVRLLKGQGDDTQGQNLTKRAF